MVAILSCKLYYYNKISVVACCLQDAIMKGSTHQGLQPTCTYTVYHTTQQQLELAGSCDRLSAPATLGEIHYAERENLTNPTSGVTTSTVFKGPVLLHWRPFNIGHRLPSSSFQWRFRDSGSSGAHVASWKSWNMRFWRRALLLP